jgi:hypothetical protein
MDKELPRLPRDGCRGRAAPGREAAAELERRGGSLFAPAWDGEGRAAPSMAAAATRRRTGRDGRKERKKETNRYVCNE